MQTPFNTILNLLIESPGNMIFHLALAFAVISSLQAALITQRTRKDAISNRIVLGFSMLLIAQIILYLCSGLAWQNVLDERVFLPPLDRAVTLFSLVWIVWMWCFPKPARLGDLVTGFLGLGVIVLFLFTYTSWSQENLTLHFNATWIDQVWELAALFIVLTGMAVLLFSRPVGWGFGIGMLSLLLTGNIAHLLLAPIDKDLSGYIRLAQLAAYPILPTLLNRFTTATDVSLQKPVPAETTPYPRTQERRRFSADPRTVHTLLALNAANEPGQILSGVTNALAHTMLSDICFLVSGSTFNQITLQPGYDLIREEAISGTILDQTKAPMLAGALQRGKSLTITANDVQPPDMATISAALGLKEAGSLMFIPLTESGRPQGGLLFLSPYSNRQWNADDMNFLSLNLENINSIIKRATQPISAPSAQPVQTETVLSTSTLQAELENLRQDNQVLLAELGEYRLSEAKIKPAPTNSDIDALVALQQEAQEQIANLQLENERLQKILASGSYKELPENNSRVLEQELRRSLQDVATLQNQLAEANTRNLILERENRQNVSSGHQDLELITSAIQEIRQPIASINGYTDLLLNDSAGAIGALQRKFLERILSSTERLHSILENLVRVTRNGDRSVETFPQSSIELSAIIDGAVSDISTQLREKNIAMQLDLPDEMPQIIADQETVQQIILQLLQNAVAATPKDNAIGLRLRIQKDQENDFLHLQVTDQGGGVRPEDMQRVFARRYRVDRPIIQGIGDTGAGLSIVKSLVESQSGRIWMDCTPGQSTTFSVLLPLHPMFQDSSMA